MSENSVVILIVDDEPFNIDIIIRHLRVYDYTIVTAADGEEAWTKLEQAPNQFDLILLDRMMPKMDGLEVLHRMKQHAVLNQVPVILQTARAGKSDILTGIQAGAFYYLTKPFDEKMLISVIHTALEQRLSYKILHNELQRNIGTLGLMQSTQFIFRNLVEGRHLSTFLANACSVPDKVVMGLSELLTNAVEHGIAGITYQEKTVLNENGTWETEVNKRLEMPDNMKKFIIVDFIRDGDLVRITINDQGKGFDWQKFLQLDPARAFDNHGRGIALAKSMSFDRMEYKGNGNEVMVEINSPASF